MKCFLLKLLWRTEDRRRYWLRVEVETLGVFDLAVQFEIATIYRCVCVVLNVLVSFRAAAACVRHVCEFNDSNVIKEF